MGKYADYVAIVFNKKKLEARTPRETNTQDSPNK